MTLPDSGLCDIHLHVERSRTIAIEHDIKSSPKAHCVLLCGIAAFVSHGRKVHCAKQCLATGYTTRKVAKSCPTDSNDIPMGLRDSFNGPQKTFLER